MELADSDGSLSQGGVDLGGQAPLTLQCGASDSTAEQEAAAEFACTDDDGLNVGVASQTSGSWQPGVSAGPWFGPGRGLTAQSQVLITNLLLGLRGMPEHLRKLMRDLISAGCPGHPRT